MTVIYYDLEKSKHITIDNVQKVEETICDDDILVTYFERTKFQTIKKCYKVLEKNTVTSINI